MNLGVFVSFHPFGRFFLGDNGLYLSLSPFCYSFFRFPLLHHFVEGWKKEQGEVDRKVAFFLFFSTQLVSQTVYQRS